MIPHLAWSVISTVKTNFIIWETRDWSWKPANFSTKPLAETQWKRADTFKSTEALRKHETMPPFSSHTFPVVTVARKRNGIFNHQVSAAFPNCGNTSFHPVFINESLTSYRKRLFGHVREYKRKNNAKYICGQATQYYAESKCTYPTQAFTTHEEFKDYLDQISNCWMT